MKIDKLTEAFKEQLASGHQRLHYIIDNGSTKQIHVHNLSEYTLEILLKSLSESGYRHIKPQKTAVPIFGHI